MSIREMTEVIALLILPLIIVGLPAYGMFKRVPVYECFIEGAKEGWDVAVRIIPYLVAILFAMAMFKASGALEAITNLLRPVLTAIGIPPELLPMALIRPLSGGASLAVLTDLKNQFGADHMITRIAATIYGSSETTFYVLAIYFGSVGVKKTRHAVPAGLIADVAGIFLACLIVKWMFS